MTKKKQRKKDRTEVKYERARLCGNAVMMMNERARGRKEESSRRRRRHSLSFTAYFFAALACLIQLPNSIEAGWNKRDGTGCTNQIETGNVNSY